MVMLSRTWTRPDAARVVVEIGSEPTAPPIAPSTAATTPDREGTT